MHSLFRKLATLPLTALIAGCSLLPVQAAATTIPDPAKDAPLAAGSGKQTIVLAGGCFWGMQSVFEHVKGVTAVTAGYAGGSKKTAEYDIVSTGMTGHAESVQIVFDPSKVTVGQLLKVYFSVAHDPTELNRQGPDDGSQYRSSIFYTTPEQKQVADAYIAQLDAAHAFHHPIVTKVVPLEGFYAAEGYHQNYADKHPDNPYIVVNDAPKVAALKKECPALFVTR